MKQDSYLVDDTFSNGQIVSPDSDIQTEGNGHVEDDQPTYPEQAADPLGQLGPSYEREQGRGGADKHPGGSVSPNSNRGHEDEES